ncbi:hypothetical protein JST97_38380 [bacterium]|nr:hypothetical protein [bacterium]
MKYISQLLIVSYLSLLLLHSAFPPRLRLELSGQLDASSQEFLKAHQVRLGPHAFALPATAEGVRILSTLARYERRANDLCLQNLANSRTLITEDGLPYRRHFVELRPDGELLVRRDEQLAWIYDPLNPASQPEGPQKGYLASPNVDVVGEARALAAHQRLLAGYQRALLRMESMAQNLVVLDGPEDEPPKATPPVRFEELLQSMRPQPGRPGSPFSQLISTRS